MLARRLLHLCRQETSYVEVTTVNKTKGSTQECSTLTRAPPPVERYVVPKGPAVVPVFDISDFPMTLPGLPSSIASSPATTLAPEPRVPLPSATSSPKPMGPPPVQSSSPKPKAPSREQVQIEVDTIMREVEEKRAKRTADQQQLHDAMLSAIFKSVFEDTVPDSAVGIYSSGRRTAWGVTFPRLLTLGHCQRESRMTS